MFSVSRPQVRVSSDFHLNEKPPPAREHKEAEIEKLSI